MKTVILGIFLLILLGAFLMKRGGISPAHPAVKLIDSASLKKVIQENPSLQLVDVRKPMEFKMGAIQPAVNIDYFGSDFISKFQKYDKNKALYLYCRSGARSNKAAHLLANEGFTEIYDLQGGYLAWK